MCDFEIMTRNLSLVLSDIIESTNVSKKQNKIHWEEHWRGGTKHEYGELSKAWQEDILQWGSTLEDWRLRQIKKSEDKHWPTTWNYDIGQEFLATQRKCGDAAQLRNSNDAAGGQHRGNHCSIFKSDILHICAASRVEERSITISAIFDTNCSACVLYAICRASWYYMGHKGQGKVW